MTDPLQTLLDRLVPALRPEAVYLFGSRARGDAHADSDYDLLVVMPDDAPAELRSPVAAYRAKLGTGIPADIIPVRRSAFERRRATVGTLSHRAVAEGRLVYGR
ncbi:MAG: nucleotidyltransferase domain-containing protein [Caenispirillum bisanense]|nr:nucleotidyltransferase domain-containing protein [Caenispirillum bisanense]MCA1974087.1 nucleotidyltransferase domain-containing protein [Caenispirillum sp.]